MASQLVMGMDLDPASTDDFRHVVAQTLAPDGYVVLTLTLTLALTLTLTLTLTVDRVHSRYVTIAAEVAVT